MRYNVEITRKAQKQAMKIPLRDRARIFAGIRNLTDSETWGDVRKLVNHEYDYRLRIGKLPGIVQRHCRSDGGGERYFRRGDQET